MTRVIASSALVPPRGRQARTALVAVALLACSAARAETLETRANPQAWQRTAPKDIAALKPLLHGRARHWYRYSKPLDPAHVDIFFPTLVRRAAAYEGRISPLFLAGSDLIEAAIGLPKLAGLRSAWRGKALSEVNIVDTRSDAQRRGSDRRDRMACALVSGHLGVSQARLERSFVVDARGRFIDLQVGPYEPREPLPGRRDAYKGTVYVNGEGNWDLATFTDNASHGRFLVEDAPQLAVPFKHGYLARIDPDGSAHLLSRTEKDAQNYDDKLLTLPNETRFPAQWHRLAGLRLSSMNHWAQDGLMYSLAVYARSRPAGWRFSATTESILQTWADYLTRRPPHVFFKDRFVDRLHARLASQGLWWHGIDDVLSEFRLGLLDPVRPARSPMAKTAGQ